MQLFSARWASFLSSYLPESVTSYLPDHLANMTQDVSLFQLAIVIAVLLVATKSLVSVIVLIVNLAVRVGIHLVPSRLYRYAHVSRTGQPPWALITGTTQGIGLCLANEFAARGFNIVLHGRNEEKLFGVKEDLQRRYPQRSFRMLVADASAVPCSSCERDSSATVNFDTIKQSLKDIHLTVLLNNAGSGPINPTYASLGDCSQARLQDNLSLNGLFPIHLARTLLPQLIENSPSLILNISSFADQGFPRLVSYSASKQFMLNWTKSVGLEMRMEDHDVETLIVRIAKTTDTSFSKSEASLFMPRAATMAKAIVQKIGWGHGVVTAYWGHAIQESFLALLPDFAKGPLFISVIHGEQADELKNAKKL